MTRAYVIFYFIANTFIAACVLVIVIGTIPVLTMIAEVEGRSALFRGASLTFWAVFPFGAAALYILARRLVSLARAWRARSDWPD